MRSDRWLSAIGLLVLSSLLVGTLWVVPYLPTNDGPEWVLATHIENHYGDPGTLYREIFVPSIQFASHGFAAIYGPLEAWLGWQRGLEVALSLTTLLVAWGFSTLVRALAPGRWALGFLGFPLSLSWEFYMGFWAFVVSTGLGLFILALAVRLRAPTWRGRALLALLLLVQAVAHLFGAMLTGASLLVLALFRVPRAERLREVGRVALTGLPAGGIMALSMVGSGDMARVPLQHDVVRLPLLIAARIFPQTVAPGPLGRAVVSTLLLGLFAIVAAVRVGRRDADPADRGIGAVAVVLLLAGALAPLNVPGWQGFSQRFVPLGTMLAVAVFPLERLSAATARAASLGLFIAACGWLALTYSFHRRLEELCPDALAGLSGRVRIQGEVFPVVLRNAEPAAYDPLAAEVPLLSPLLHMHALYEAAHGGVPSGYFGDGRGIYPFKIRPRVYTRPRPNAEHYSTVMNEPEFHLDRAFRREVEGELASFASFYDEVALFGASPDDLALFRDRGFVPDWAQGTAMLAHFQPCSVDFVGPTELAAPASAPSFDLRVGKLGLMADVQVPAVLSEDGLAHFEIAPSPCGIVAIHPRWQRASLGCANANAEGDLVARISRTSHRVTCAPL